nr:MAG TPA: hypothetical protein [Caudoviricetes sp.]
MIPCKLRGSQYIHLITQRGHYEIPFILDFSGYPNERDFIFINH